MRIPVQPSPHEPVRDHRRPAGLYAAYYAGFCGLRTTLVDSLSEPGGQVTALYPEKMIYDVAGSR